MKREQYTEAERRKRILQGRLSMVVGVANLAGAALNSFVGSNDPMGTAIIWANYLSALMALPLGFLIIRHASKSLSSRPKNTAPSISKAPGSRLLAVVEYLYSPKTVEGVFKPIIADWRVEVFGALKEGNPRKAAWIRVRYTFSFIMAMGLSKILSVLRSVAHR